MRALLGISFLIFYSIGLTCSSSIPCDGTYTELGFICRCNSSYCDTFPEIPDKRDALYHMYTGFVYPGFFLAPLFQPNFPWNNAIEIKIELSDVRNPNLMGFGGAFTDSFGYVLRKLSPGVRDRLLRSYFAPEGNRYSICRMPIGTCDSSPNFYDYDPVPDDLDLSHFSLRKEDFEYKISIVHEVLGIKSDRELKLIGTNWIPPPWMKKNNSTNPGYLRDNLYQIYANYISRFLQEYEKQGIKFWGITPVNQGTTGIFSHADIPNLILLPHQQRRYIAENLGPTLKDDGFGYLKIIANDDQRKMVAWIMDELVGEPVAYNYTSGVGVHWYADLMYPGVSAKMLDIIHEKYPDKFLLYTESSISKIFDIPIGAGSWKAGAFFAYNIIQDLNHYVSGWLEYSLALDTSGGPNYSGFNSDASIIVETEQDRFYKQPTFYVMGHFSGLTEPGAKVLGVNIQNPEHKRRRERSRPQIPVPNFFTFDLKEGLDVTAVSNPDGRIIVFVANRYQRTKNLTLLVTDEGILKKTIQAGVPGLSMNSIIFYAD